MEAGPWVAGIARVLNLNVLDVQMLFPSRVSCVPGTGAKARLKVVIALFERVPVRQWRITLVYVKGTLVLFPSNRIVESGQIVT